MAVGLTLIFGVLRVINLAHGSLFMMGAYAAFLVVRTFGSLWLALPVAILLGVALGPVVGHGDGGGFLPARDGTGNAGRQAGDRR